MADQGGRGEVSVQGTTWLRVHRPVLGLALLVGALASVPLSAAGSALWPDALGVDVVSAPVAWLALLTVVGSLVALGALTARRSPSPTELEARVQGAVAGAVAGGHAAATGGAVGLALAATGPAITLATTPPVDPGRVHEVLALAVGGALGGTWLAVLAGTAVGAVLAEAGAARAHRSGARGGAPVLLHPGGVAAGLGVAALLVSVSTAGIGGLLARMSAGLLVAWWEGAPYALATLALIGGTLVAADAVEAALLVAASRALLRVVEAAAPAWAGRARWALAAVLGLGVLAAVATAGVTSPVAWAADAGWAIGLAARVLPLGIALAALPLPVPPAPPGPPSTLARRGTEAALVGWGLGGLAVWAPIAAGAAVSLVAAPLIEPVRAGEVASLLAEGRRGWNWILPLLALGPGSALAAALALLGAAGAALDLVWALWRGRQGRSVSS